MTDQEFDQLFDNGESILETLDISTAHRINCPTDLMTNQHPITPPPELVHQWVDMLSSRSDQAVFTMAAQWGADQELEACCKWLFESAYPHKVASVYLRTARRPKPPSLKEQAMAQLQTVEEVLNYYTSGCIVDTIRRALESLDD
jgi:hypothetical protein